MPLLTCSFLIPLRRGAKSSVGEPHSDDDWRWLHNELLNCFGRVIVCPGEYASIYRDSDTGERMTDTSRQLMVPVPEDRVPQLRKLLVVACERFQQNRIYLSVAGYVEFVTVATK